MRAKEFLTNSHDTTVVRTDIMRIANLVEQQTPAQRFIEKIYNQYPEWPYGQADRVMVWGEGDDQQFAAFKLKPSLSPDTVEIDWLMAGPEQRKGIGSRAIQELQRQANESGVKLSLYPWGKGRISQSSLSKLYKRHGFKPLAKGAKQMTWSPDLKEAFDQPYPLTWEKSEADESVDALARLPDGSNLSIMFNQDLDDEGQGIYSVEFWRNHSQEVTGEGDAQRVFATVLAAIEQFIKKRNPEQLYFSANKDVEPGQKAGSRSNLYTSLVRRYASALGYEADVSDFAGSTTYKLYRLNEQQVQEVTIVPTVTAKKKQHLDVMPNDGRPIPQGQEAEYLGQHVGNLGSVEVWTYSQGHLRTFVVFDPQTRISQLAVSGSSYPGNANSLIIKGVYSGPKNATRAANLYAWLITKQGLTLVSDIKQSQGGYKVWKDLERRFGRYVNVHGFNTKTNKPVNVGTQDEPDTHVGQEHLPGATRDVKDTAKNVRLVASPK
jgi:GNAT superfamily N-acetyltransferase